MAPRVAVGGRCGSSGPGLAARDNAAEAARASHVVAGSGCSAPSPAARDRHPLPAVRTAGPLAPARPGSRRAGDAGWRRHKGRRGGDCKAGRQLGRPETACRAAVSVECGCRGRYPLPASGPHTARPAPRHPEPLLHLRPARLLLPRPPALRGGACRRRPIIRRMQIGGGTSREDLLSVLVREFLDQPSVLFPPRPTLVYVHLKLFCLLVVCPGSPESKGLSGVHSGRHRGEPADPRIHSMNVL